ncbi:MAG: hypothetical protein NZZ41_00655 [Candidatus Dojkabacteria bacterium]|nr:hypothetical protein [Candidatus Dojkabacteria bacterium]
MKKQNLNLLVDLKNSTLVTKIKNTLNVLFKEKPKIELKNGSFIDFEKNEFYLVGDFTLHVTGNLYIRADKHICINSGCEKEKEREGYNYSIWLNTELNEKNLPIKKQ